jgi:TRAP-type C4-dicarboxylate transport system permease small subunit
MEASLSWVYFPGIIFAVLGGLMIAMDFFQLLSGQTQQSNLTMFQESEEKPQQGSH